MATAKKNNYITTELLWAEEQLISWKTYIDANPLDKLEDRKAWKETKAGGAMPVVVATIESQVKAITELMIKYLALLEIVNKLREQEEQKKEKIRGNESLSPMENGDI